MARSNIEIWWEGINSSSCWRSTHRLLRGRGGGGVGIGRRQAAIELCPPPGFGSSPHPLPFSKLDRRHTGRLRKRDDLLTGERGGGRVWRRSQIIPRREILVLYKSFNTLWLLCSSIWSWRMCLTRAERTWRKISSGQQPGQRTHTKNYKYILDLIFNGMQRMNCDYSISLFQDASWTKRTAWGARQEILQVTTQLAELRWSRGGGGLAAGYTLVVHKEHLRHRSARKIPRLCSFSDHF